MSVPSPLSYAPSRRLDDGPLTEPVDERALSSFIAESKADNAPWSQMTTGLRRPAVAEVLVVS